MSKIRCNWRPKPDPEPVLIKGDCVEVVHTYKYLGVQLDDKLDWTANTDALCRKVIPHKLTTKLFHLGFNSTLCDWLLDFLTGRPQSVRIGGLVSGRIKVNTGTTQECVLSPVLYSLFTHDCVTSHKEKTILKFADDTTVIGLISGGDETAYRSEVASLVKWCDSNNLSLNTDKTKEMVLDMTRERGGSTNL
ncbi:hypothetical protein L3Q82_008343 [Scortum barcoo]|uniref:Uncharacterized protein n=1 Tax=Scortum barcoo TaxID=214431 RepID=A0ACB8WH85_9TELE|nr:hypothetical protein L3Q82_008343 [Scortum barcoo]